MSDLHEFQTKLQRRENEARIAEAAKLEAPIDILDKTDEKISGSIRSRNSAAEDLGSMHIPNIAVPELLCDRAFKRAK